MRQERAIVLILSGLLVREAWLLLPESTATYRLFPFYDIEITMQTYVAFACHYAFILCLAAAFVLVLPRHRDILTIWFFIQSIEFVDYFLTYNSAWLTVAGLGIGITVIKLTVIPICFIYKLLKND